MAALKWPHVSVADSLAMGDAAVKMADAGVSSVACLGVDFMAESVRATLDAKGHQGVPVSLIAPCHSPNAPDAVVLCCVFFFCLSSSGVSY